MKGVKLNLNLETVNCVLLVVILALVIYCVVKQNEGFEEDDRFAAVKRAMSPEHQQAMGTQQFINASPDRLKAFNATRSYDGGNLQREQAAQDARDLHSQGLIGSASIALRPNNRQGSSYNVLSRGGTLPGK